MSKSTASDKKFPQGHTQVPVAINRDGTLNIHRPREFSKFFFDLYHYFLAIPWPKFFTILIVVFIVFNTLFGFFYFSMGPKALSGIRHDNEFNRLMDCFFFSVKSIDGVSPVGLWPNLIAMIESYLGMLTLVIVTGLLYARFARPRARVIFSDNAIMSTYNHKPCIVFRVANERLNQIVEARMTVTVTKMETSLEGETSRKLYNLELENDYSPVFALSWTIRHFINESSPLFEMNVDKMKESQVVIFASLSGLDDTFAQTIAARTVYRYDEIVANKRFKNILVWKDNKMHVDLKGIHDMI